MYYPQKYKSLEEALDGRHTWRTQGSKVVFTNGCFDLLHAGHVTYLSQAKALGDKLVLGLNSDKSIRTIKGDSRPLVSLDNRVILLDALSMIDMIVSFDEATPVALIQALKPDIHVKGGDYQPDALPEYPVVKRYGGEVRILSFVEGLSTTRLVDRIRSLPGT